MSLNDRIDHMRTLSGQTKGESERVLYTKSGTRLSATRIASNDMLIDHMAYWTNVHSADEGAYLAAILNSAAVLAKISDMQPHGQRDKRHFDNLVWTLPIPEYDEADLLHRDLAAAALRAEAVAAAVPFTEGQHFVAKRKAIRAALAEDGIAAEIEALVAALLP